MFIGQNQFCSSDLLAKIADVIDSAVLITRLGSSGHYDQRIIYINQAFSNLTGYGHDELLGRSIDILCDPRTGASKMLEFYSNCRTSQNFSLSIDSFKKQGSELKIKLEVRPIVDNVQGAYYYIIMCKPDVANQQQVNPNNYQFAQPQFNNSQFNGAQFNGSGYGHPQYAAPQANFQQNYTPNYQAQQQYVPPVYAAPKVEPRQEPAQGARQSAVGAYAPTSAAAQFSAMQSPQPQPNQGPEDFGIPVAPVIESKKPAEIKTDEKIADYCKTQFLANMSHDLRTPLNAIIGFSEVIKDQLFGPIENNRYVSYASDIHKSGRELLGTINEIMELSEVEPEAEKIDEEKVDLSDVVESVLDVLSPKAFESDVKIIKSLDAADVKFKGDRRKLKQTIAGIVGNALKSSKKGSKIELSTSITDRGDFRFVVYAPTANLSSSSKSSLGSLLGTVTKKMENDNPEVSLARKFVEAHQGKFSVFHSASSGTEMNITLPAVRISIEPEKKTWLKVIS